MSAIRSCLRYIPLLGVLSPAAACMGPPDPGPVDPNRPPVGCYRVVDPEWDPEYAAFVSGRLSPLPELVRLDARPVDAGTEGSEVPRPGRSYWNSGEWHARATLEPVACPP